MLPVLPAEDAQVLADTLFAASLGFGLGDAPDEDQLGAQQQFLELYTVYPD